MSAEKHTRTSELRAEINLYAGSSKSLAAWKEHLTTMRESDRHHYYTDHKLSDAQIDFIMKFDNAGDLSDLYRYQQLNEKQIDNAIDKGLELHTLFLYKELNSKQIDRSLAIARVEDLGSLYECQKMTPAQVDKAIAMGHRLDRLYRYQTLTPKQIDRAFTLNVKDIDIIYNICEHQKLTSSQIDSLIESDNKYLQESVYRYQPLTSEQVYTAVKRGEQLHVLFEKYSLTNEQVNDLIKRANSGRQADEHTLVNVIYAWKGMTTGQLANILATPIGKEEDVLIAIGIHEHASTDQISYVIDHAIGLSQLLKNKNLNTEHIDKLIKKWVDITEIYRFAGSKFTDAQFKQLINREGITIPASMAATFYSEPVWREIGRIDDLEKSVRAYALALQRRKFQGPIDILVGTDTVELKAELHPQELELTGMLQAFAKEHGYEMHQDDYDYFYTDKGKIKIGKVLKAAGGTAIARVYEVQKSKLKSDETYTFEYSNRPIDILSKSTGQFWTSCEAVGKEYGTPKFESGEQIGHCGWYDDIENNNIIVIVRRKGSDRWAGRIMLRWGKTDTGKIAVGMEKFYGDDSISAFADETVRKKLKELDLFKPCKTPYYYSGYTDYGNFVEGKEQEHTDEELEDYENEEAVYSKISYGNR